MQTGRGGGRGGSGNRGGGNGGGEKRGGGSNRGRGGGGRGGSGGTGGATPKKEQILDLGRYLDKRIRVKFAGGREVSGVLKGFDQLLNLVIDDTEEYIYSSEDSNKEKGRRNLGLVVCRGTTLILISPFDGHEEISNPFLPPE